MSVKKYLDDHNQEEFWKQIFNSTQQTLMAKNQIIKIEANKLRAERIKLILDNIQDILEGEVKRLQIKNQMTQIKKQKTENLIKEFQQIKNEKTHTSYKFLIEKDKEVLKVFQLPQLMESLRDDKQEYNRIKDIVKNRLKEYPILQKLLIKQQTKDNVQIGDDYLLHQKYIEGKQLNQDDIFLLESSYWALATKKLQQKELGRLLQGLWKDGELKENILGKRMQQIQKKFRQQVHF